MLPDRVSNPGPLTYESGALPIALCDPALSLCPCLCLRIVLFDMRLVNNFIIAMCGVMKYSLLIPNLVAFYARQLEH